MSIWDMKRQLGKFMLIGVTNTTLDFFAYLFFTRTLAVHFLIANALSFLLAMTWSFYWNKRWTFMNASLAYRTQYVKFFFVSIIALVLSQAILYVSISFFGWRDIVGKVIATVVGVFWSFTTHRLWTFRSSL